MVKPRVDLDRLPDLIRAIHHVPMELRRFQATAKQARSLHRIDGELLDTLVTEGLPTVGTGDGRLFDDYDLGNVALHLGLMTTRRMAIRSWASALRRHSEAELTRCRIEYVPSCPAPGHRGPCDFDLLMPSGRRKRAVAGQEPARIEVALRGQWPDLPGAARALVAELAELKFFILPEAIRWDMEFMRRTSIADCGVVAKALVDEGRRLGFEARFAFGLLVVKPYSTPHCWAEFKVDELWVPQDPLLLTAARTWGSLDGEAWPAGRSPGAVFARLHDRFTKVASHRGMWSPISLSTEYLT